MAKKRVADGLVDTLITAGVKRVYGLVGDSLNRVTASIGPRKKLQWVPVRHEETAAFAAGAEGQLTGQLAMCAGNGAFMSNAVLSERREEIVDLAKVNLFS